MEFAKHALKALEKTLSERYNNEEQKNVSDDATMGIEIGGKSFSLRSLVESLVDPLEASQLGVNTAGNLSTLVLLIALIQRDGFKEHQLNIIGTVLGFAGWGALVASAAQEHNDKM
jgi:hypothetical protein